MLTPEQIEVNWNTFCAFFDKLGERSKPAKDMLETLGTTFATAPASTRKEYHRAFTGGLVEHSLRVLKNAVKLKKAFGWDLPDDSLIIGCLFHDLGKVGHVTDDGTVIDYYVENESDWHRKQGKMFEINDAIPHFATPDRALWLCMKFGLKLTYDEYCAIRCADGQFTDENIPYKGREPLLATCVHLADYVSTREEKREEKHS